MNEELMTTFDAMFPTVGDAILQVVVAHTAFHADHLAVWQRVIGRPSAAVFI